MLIEAFLQVESQPALLPKRSKSGLWRNSRGSCSLQPTMHRIPCNSFDSSDGGLIQALDTENRKFFSAKVARRIGDDSTVCRAVVPNVFLQIWHR